MPRCATSIKFRAAERRILQHPPDGSESADFAQYRAFRCLSRRFSHEIRWNPESQEWFCARCGRTSDHLIKEDAQASVITSKAANGYQFKTGQRMEHRDQFLLRYRLLW